MDPLSIEDDPDVSGRWLYRLYQLLRGDTDSPEKQSEGWAGFLILAHALIGAAGILFAVYARRIDTLQFVILVALAAFVLAVDVASGYFWMHSLFVVSAIHTDSAVLIASVACWTGWMEWGQVAWFYGVLHLVLSMFATSVLLHLVWAQDPYTPDSHRRARDWRRLRRVLVKLVVRSPRARDLLEMQPPPKACEPSRGSRKEPCASENERISVATLWIFLRILTALVLLLNLTQRTRTVEPNQWTILLSLFLLADGLLAWFGLPPWMAMWSILSSLLSICMFGMVAANGSDGGKVVLVYLAISLFTGIALAGVWTHCLLVRASLSRSVPSAPKDPSQMPVFRDALREFYQARLETVGRLPTREEARVFVEKETADRWKARMGIPITFKAPRLLVGAERQGAPHAANARRRRRKRSHTQPPATN